MAVLETQLEHEGKTYEAQIATVKEVNLGYEDHGVLGWNIDFFGPSWGQGTWYRGIGSGGYFPSLLKELLAVFEVNDWSQIKGKKVYIIRSEKFSDIIGISSLDGAKVFMINEHAEKFTDAS